MAEETAERDTLRRALDRAVELRSGAGIDHDIEDELLKHVVAEIVEPLIGGVLRKRFAEEVSPVEDENLSWKEWFEDPGTGMARIRAVRQAFCRWILPLQPLAPSGYVGQLTVALQALNRDENNWLSIVERGRGKRSKPFTREQFALLFCRELEFLRGWEKLSAAQAFYELTGNMPKRNARIRSPRALKWPPVRTLDYTVYENLRGLVDGKMLEVARRAGEALRTGGQMTGDQAIFVQTREARLLDFEAGGLDTMWESVRRGNK